MISKGLSKYEWDLTGGARENGWGFLNDAVTLEDPTSGVSHQINMIFPFSHSAATVYTFQRRQRKEVGAAFL